MNNPANPKCNAEGDTLKTEFIGGKPYQVDMSLAIYDEVEKNGQIQID